MSRTRKSQEELLEDLKIQLQLLINSAKSFDAGHYYEAVRIAAIFRNLFVDKGKSNALLNQLNIKNEIVYLSTIVEECSSKNLLPQTPLIFSRTIVAHNNAKSMRLPIFDEFLKISAEWINSFNDWWNTPVLVDGKGNTFTREKLILEVAETDGGVHVDPSLPEDYYNLKHNNSLNQVLVSNYGGVEKVQQIENNPAYMSIRQICYEFMYSIKESQNELLKTLNLRDIFLYDKRCYTIS